MGIAKFKPSLSIILNVVIPIRFPEESNSPPPEDPWETWAVV
jgi:hypothetical protein